MEEMAAANHALKGAVAELEKRLAQQVKSSDNAFHQSSLYIQMQTQLDKVHQQLSVEKQERSAAHKAWEDADRMYKIERDKAIQSRAAFQSGRPCSSLLCVVIWPL
jgi:hypothetical protein